MALININISEHFESFSLEKNIVFNADGPKAFLESLLNENSEVANLMLTARHDFRRYLLIFANKSRVYSVNDIAYNQPKVDIDVLPSISGG